MFHYDRALKLTRAGLAIDARHRQPRGFISHAHSDHMARHELALCTPATGLLYQLRMKGGDVLELPYRQPYVVGDVRLTTYPAGHCLGSAMLLAEDGDQSMLYTGDFKLGESATSERAELPRADILVMETTYGVSRYRMPPREEVVDKLERLIRLAIDAGRVALIFAYALGKAQEVTRLLTLRGLRVRQHPEIATVSNVYQECGVDLGPYEVLTRENCREPAVAIVPPWGRRGGPAFDFDAPVKFAVTGWSIDEATRYRHGVDYALPLSDHADFDELFEAVERVRPRVIYCTHGPESFVDRLREAGHEAYPLGKAWQKRLF
jgi:Cft2 family RNA processing exonuclease